MMEITKDENTPPLNSSQSSSGKNSHSTENSTSKSAGTRTVLRNLSANFNDLPACSQLVKGSGAAEGEEAVQVAENKDLPSETEPADDAQIADENPPDEDDEAEKEAWAERTAVITRLDHEIHCDLARKFVEDVADQAVGQSCEQNSLKKLPDLVPDVPISEPADEQVDQQQLVERPASSQNEDSEYESADDEFPLQDTLYLDPSTNTANTPSEHSVSVTPEVPEELPKDEERPEPGVLDSTLVDSASEVPESQNEQEDLPDFATEETDSTPVGSYQTQPQSFLLASASDLPVVESEPDFSGYTSESSDPARNDVDLELITKFESLTLDKQQQEGSESVSPAVEEVSVTEETFVVEEPAELPEPVVEAPETSTELTEPVESFVPIESIVEAPETFAEFIEPVESFVPTESIAEASKPAEDPESVETVIEEPSEVIEPVESVNEPELVNTEDAVNEPSPEPVNQTVNELEIVDKHIEALNEESPVETELIVANEPSAPEPVKEEPVVKEEVNEEPVIPRKGYDLSFLDRLEDAEFATPPGVKPSRASRIPSPKKSPFKSKLAVRENSVASPPKPANPPAAEPSEEAAQVTAEDTSSALNVTPVETQPSDVKEESSPAEVLPLKQEIPPPVEPSVDEVIVVPKKGYDLSFLDKLDDLEHAAPPGLPTSGPAQRKSIDQKVKPEMKEKSEMEAPADEQATSPSQEQKSEKKIANRKPIRPRIARPVATGGAGAAPKKDPFEPELTFDPSEDPFKPKAKLASSPPRGSIEPAPVPTAKSNRSPEQDRFENGDFNNQTDIDFSDQLQQQLDEEEHQQRLSAALAQEEFRPAGEVFQDPSDLDFLMQHGGSSKDIALARQSLFVKFDPLVQGRPSLFPTQSDASDADETLTHIEKSTRTSGESLFLFSPPHGSAAPAPAASGVTDRRTERNQRPVADLEASGVQQRLVSGDVVVLSEHKEALKLQELLFQDRLLQKDREIQVKDKEMDEVRTKLEATLEAQAQMRQIVGEYEKTISQLIAEKEREKASMEQTLQSTAKERDQAIEDLKEVERAFSEFHRMYERNRAAAEGLHKNEEALKKAMTAYQERLQQEQHKYETLKLHAAQKLEGAQQEMENMKRTLEAETSRVKAVLKKTEMRLASVEMTLDQKTKENEELTKLCDELINKLGSGASH